MGSNSWLPIYSKRWSSGCSQVCSRINKNYLFKNYFDFYKIYRAVFLKGEFGQNFTLYRHFKSSTTKLPAIFPKKISLVILFGTFYLITAERIFFNDLMSESKLNYAWIYNREDLNGFQNLRLCCGLNRWWRSGYWWFYGRSMDRWTLCNSDSRWI